MLLLIVYLALFAVAMTGFNRFAPIDAPYKALIGWLALVGMIVFVAASCGVFTGHVHWPHPPAL